MMTFSEALEKIREYELVARSGWNGKGMFVFLVDGSTFEVNRPPLNVIFPEGTQIDYHPHIDMKLADGTIAVWTVSQLDVLASDWVVVDSEGNTADDFGVPFQNG